MGMPNHLVLVRHGLSEGNLATEAAKHGDFSYYTDAFTTTPGHQWRLAPKGRLQAEAIGKWVTENISDSFDRYYVSPYVRTRETAGTLGLPGARWRFNRALRERDWGDIGSVPRDQFETLPEFRLNAWMKENDPLYWVPTGGESIAHAAENRVRNVCSTLHRECDGQTVICVAHGEIMWGFRLVLERLDDDTFAALDDDPAEKIHNCEALHYTRVDPFWTPPRGLARLAWWKRRQPVEPRLTWLRRAYPVIDGDTVRIVVSPWVRFDMGTLDNDELLAAVAAVPTLFDGHPTAGAHGTDGHPAATT